MTTTTRMKVTGSDRQGFLDRDKRISKPMGRAGLRARIADLRAELENPEADLDFIKDRIQVFTMELARR